MDIFALLTTNTLAIAVLGFLLKLWFDKRLTKTLEKELESFKVPLAKEVSLYSIQSGWNHTKKMELLSELYEKMIEADFELKALLMNIKVGNKKYIDKRAHSFCEKYLELNSLLHKNELFLEQPLVDEVREIYKPYFEAATESIDDDFDFKGFGESLPEFMDEVMNVADSPRKRVIEIFRRSAGWLVSLRSQYSQPVCSVIAES